MLISWDVFPDLTKPNIHFNLTYHPFGNLSGKNFLIKLYCQHMLRTENRITNVISLVCTLKCANRGTSYRWSTSKWMSNMGQKSMRIGTNFSILSRLNIYNQNAQHLVHISWNVPLLGVALHKTQPATPEVQWISNSWILLLSFHMLLSLQRFMSSSGKYFWINDKVLYFCLFFNPSNYHLP